MLFDPFASGLPIEKDPLGADGASEFVGASVGLVERVGVRGEGSSDVGFAPLGGDEIGFGGALVAHCASTVQPVGLLDALVGGPYGLMRRRRVGCRPVKRWLVGLETATGGGEVVLGGGEFCFDLAEPGGGVVAATFGVVELPGDVGAECGQPVRSRAAWCRPARRSVGGGGGGGVGWWRGCRRGRC